ncbi:membrane protein [hydrothermal vent metagenome]|uniref:Membrane protein n=1 Tax=hydrothermal vent metagenome TaxID=652676 RepID=A0A1W1B8T8_9ZZZZ
MSEGLEKLRKIGAQKIHEQTHIAHKYVQALLHESFEGMQKVQALGFISILEREYDVDLSSLKEEVKNYFKPQEDKVASEEEKISQQKDTDSTKPNDKRLYALLLAGGIFLLIVLYMSMQDNKEKSIKPSKKKIVIEKNETNQTKEQNTTLKREKSESIASKQKIEHSLVIVPRSKVWFGYIDLKSGKKRQKIFTQPFELNASKNYLMFFGHGYIDILIDKEKKSFKDPKSIKFLYKDGELKKISNQEFRKYNRGKLW